jgi:hypothetical protein
LAVKDIGVEGVGLSFDGGILLAAPWTFIPTLVLLLETLAILNLNKEKEYDLLPRLKIQKHKSNKLMWLWLYFQFMEVS